MSDDLSQSAPRRSTKKKDPAPRGVFKLLSGVWAVRFTCGAGHIHEERVGPLKSDGLRTHAARRQRAYGEPGWCPAMERRETRELAQARRERERRRMTFREYASDYLAWSATVHRSQRTAQYEVHRLASSLANMPLDAITHADVERVVRVLGETLAPASVNRLRDRLSGMFTRARRLGLLAENPVKDIPKLKEAGSRLAFVSATGEAALLAALPAERRPLVVLSINTGLRWSEQASLRWEDVDLLMGFLTVCLGKNGQARRVPLNSAARGGLMDLAAQRRRTGDRHEPVCRAAYRTVSREFLRAVQAAQGTLRAAGQEAEATRLDGVTWHALRHTFASRLVAAGVDLRTVQELGGWRTLSMVQRYAHLSPGHLVAAVEKIVAVPAEGPHMIRRAVELGQNLDLAEMASQTQDTSS
jgi:site-specific recombinase XerD